jgi:hypothetical protein
MKILLDEAESRKWLHVLECEKTPEESSRLPDDTGHKRPLVRLSTEQKDDILRMAAEGRKVPDIAAALGINGRRVSGVIQGHKHPIQANIAAQADREFYARQASHKDVTAFIEEASQKLAANGSTTPIVIRAKEPESPARALTVAMGEMVKKDCSVVPMVSMINAEFGTHFTKDDITKMRDEL